MDKALRHLLREHRKTIVARWRELLFDSYSPDAARFLKREPDPFANPVGQTITRALDPLWDQLVESPDCSSLAPLVDDILRIRAVQRFKPSEALRFFFLLKRVVRDELKVDSLDRKLLNELLLFEARIDELALLAFDTYLGCREKIYEIRATELRRRSERVLDKLNRRFGGGADELPPTPAGLDDEPLSNDLDTNDHRTPTRHGRLGSRSTPQTARAPDRADTAASGWSSRQRGGTT